MAEPEQNNSGGCIGIIVLIFIIACITYAFNGFQNPSDDYSQSVGGFLGIGVEYPSKIMKYEGSRHMLVCKIPYYDTKACYTLLVASNGEVFSRIDFPKGGYLEIDDVECFEVSSWYGNKGDFRYGCNVIDTKGGEWDIFNLGFKMDMEPYPSDNYSQPTGGNIDIDVENPNNIMEYEGVKKMLVCKNPYYETKDCLVQDVVSNGTRFTVTIFPKSENFKVVEVDNVECYEVPSGNNNKGGSKYGCTITDKKGEKLDIFNVGSYMDILQSN